MIWNKIKKLAGFKESNGIAPANTTAVGQSEESSPSTVVTSQEAPKPLPEVAWVGADANPWYVPILDVRPVTLTMMSTSKDRKSVV